MAIIVISHTSTFTSYLIAFSIFLYYRNKTRSIKIIVVELNINNLNKTNHDLKPWCGVNTLNNLRFDKHAFFVHHLLFQTLLLPELGMLALNLVNISSNVKSHPVNMDIPLKSQNDVIHVSISESMSSTVGFIYHPIALMNKLRFIMSATNKVVFTSLATDLTLNVLIENIQSLEPYEDVISLDYTGEKSRSMNRFDYLIHSNLTSVRYMKSRTAMCRKPPSFILWLPKFRGDLGVSGYSSLEHRIIRQHRCIKVKITTRNKNMLDDQILLDLDLFYGLKIGDFTLKLIDDMINLGKINLITNRL